MRIICLNEHEVRRRNWFQLFFYDFDTGFRRHHTFRRVINLVLNEFSRRVTKSSYVPGYPTSVNVESTSLCNFKCSFCASGGSYGSRQVDILHYEEYRTIIDELAPYIYMVSLYNLGEPFLNKDIFKMIAYARMKKVAVRIATNGQLMDAVVCRELVKCKCDHIIVSLDAATKEVYDQLRPGGDFYTILNNIRTLIKTREEFKSSYPKVALQMIVMQKNEHQMEDFKRLCERLRVDVCCFSSF